MTECEPGIGGVRRERRASSSHPGKQESSGVRGWMCDCQAVLKACLKFVVLPEPASRICPVSPPVC